MSVNNPELQHRPELKSSSENTTTEDINRSLAMASAALAGTEYSPTRIAAHEANMVQKNRRLRANSRNITLFEAERRSQLDPND